MTELAFVVGSKASGTFILLLQNLPYVTISGPLTYIRDPAKRVTDKSADTFLCRLIKGSEKRLSASWTNAFSRVRNNGGNGAFYCHHQKGPHYKLKGQPECSLWDRAPFVQDDLWHTQKERGGFSTKTISLGVFFEKTLDHESRNLDNELASPSTFL